MFKRCYDCYYYVFNFDLILVLEDIDPNKLKDEWFVREKKKI